MFVHEEMRGIQMWLRLETECRPISINIENQLSEAMFNVNVDIERQTFAYFLSNLDCVQITLN